MKNLISFSIGILVLASVSFVSSVSGKSFEEYDNDKQQTYNKELKKMIYLCMEMDALSEDGIMNNPDLDEDTKGDCGYLLKTTDSFYKKYLEKKYGSISSVD